MQRFITMEADTMLHERRYLFHSNAARNCVELGASVLSLATITWCGWNLNANLTTISYAYFMLIIVTAYLCGFWKATLIAVLAATCLDYLFIPPIFHLEIAQSQNWVALAFFEIAAILISRLASREKRSTLETAIHKNGMERLYELSRNTLLLDLHHPPGPQLLVLMHRIYSIPAAAIYDAHLGRQDRIGDWDEYEEGIARDCYLQNKGSDDLSEQYSARILKADHSSVGALVVRDGIPPLIVDALAALAAIAIDRHQSFENEERIENERRSEQMRTAVLDALAHELKTPLTAIQTASAGLMEIGKINDAQLVLTELIDQEAAHLNKICTHLLLTAKLDADQANSRHEEIFVREVIQEVLQAGAGNIDPGRIAVAIEDSNLKVQADRGMLNMIITQYLDNACKYAAPHSTITFEARLSHTEAIISVHNAGSLIRIEDRERIFERFYRSPQHLNTVAGTGIGLSIVRKAAEAHRGHAWVISSEQDGTTFFLSLPQNERRPQ